MIEDQEALLAPVDEAEAAEHAEVASASRKILEALESMDAHDRGAFVAKLCHKVTPQV